MKAEVVSHQYLKYYLALVSRCSILRRGIKELWSWGDRPSLPGEFWIFSSVPMLKVARASLAFSAFLWAHFFWKLSYCDSCPLPVRITSPGNGSSSRAHRSPGPTPFPLEPPMLLYRLFRRLLVQVCHFFLCKYRREIIFTTRSLFPSSSCFPPVFFLWFLQSFRIFSKLRDTFFPSPCAGLYWSRNLCSPLPSGKPTHGDTAVLWIPARIHRDQRAGDWGKKKGEHEVLIEAWKHFLQKLQTSVLSSSHQ